MLFAAPLLPLLLLSSWRLALTCVSFLFNQSLSLSIILQKFDEFANHLFETSYERMDHISEELVSTSLQITIGAAAAREAVSSSIWPFVTVPYYETQVEKIFDMANASFVAFSPFVQTNSIGNSEWQDFSGSSAPFDHEPIGPYFAPIWQVAGGKDGIDDQMSISNRDAFDVIPNFEVAYDTLVTTATTQEGDGSATATMSGVLANQDLDEDTDGSNYIVLPNDPHALVLAPIYEKVNDAASFSSSSSIAGILSALVPWSTYFEDFVPPSPYDEIQNIDTMMMGLILVVRDVDNGQAYTFEINNPNNVTFVGIGDLHDESYTEFEVSTNFTGTMNMEEDGGSSSHLTTATTVATGTYTLSLYPSETFYFEFSTMPSFIDSGVVFFFLIAGLSFFVYDCLVQQRHKEVVSMASRNEALVSSLFPENVRNRIYNQDKKDGDGGDVAFRSQFSPRVIGENGTTEKIAHAAVAGIFDNKTQHHYLNAERAHTAEKPIADIFPETTVMFGGK